ncbi:MAG: alpha/beta fold hydrolase [Alphaproteobacteria bacterium]|nr:alpha/beta fold hydrolase [Alphaproteobacteria bacterium]
MTTYVLVHGAWHGGWCWVRVAERLRAAGHTVFTPTLTGLADRAHLMGPTLSLQTHIRDVAGLLAWEELRDVVLVGHSYGGMVITGAADRVADRIKTLVFLDALTPKHGQCAMDLRAPEQVAATFEAARTRGNGWRIPPTPAATFLVNEADRAWVDAKCTDLPLACFTEHLHLSGAADRITDRVYIRASGYPNPTFDTALATARAAGWPCHEVPVGHDVMVDAPEELTRILLESV